MRIPLTILAASLVGAGCLAAAALLPDALQAQEVPAEREATAVADVADLRKDLEVMRRLLSRSALGTAATANHRVVWYYAGGAGGSAGGSEALYVAGDGPLFILRAGFPVAPGPGSSSEPADTPTAWDEVVAEVEGRPKPGSRSGLQATYDAERVAELEADVLETLARFGANLDQVPRGEFVTVVVTGRGGLVAGGVSGARSRNAPETVVVDEDGKLLERARQTYTVAALAFSGQTGHESVLTIRVSMADCRAAQQGQLTVDDLRRRARIHRY